ncbi:MAG: hypothetical protein ACI906_002593 [Candidatus Latescibacterota bacterium]
MIGGLLFVGCFANFCLTGFYRSSIIGVSLEVEPLLTGEVRAMIEQFEPNYYIEAQRRRFEKYYKTAVGRYEQSDYRAALYAFEQCIDLIEKKELFAAEQSVGLRYAGTTDIRSMAYSGHGDTLNYGFSDLAAASVSYRKALTCQPGDKMLSFQYVEALYEQGHYREGIGVVAVLQGLGDLDLDVLLMLANLFWKAGDGAVALKYGLECIGHNQGRDYQLDFWVRDPDYYLSARSLLWEIAESGRQSEEIWLN